jgi:hypothetical protein
MYSVKLKIEWQMHMPIDGKLALVMVTTSDPDKDHNELDV